MNLCITSGEFLVRAERLWPGKPLTDGQTAVYHEKLGEFQQSEIGAILNQIIETCKFFPKVADIFEAARALGYLERPGQNNRPHDWKPTDCAMCGGSGMVAAFYSQLFERRESGAVEILQLVGLCPYHKSTAEYRKPDHDIRAFFLCSCPSGSAVTLPRGLPRWNKEKPLYQRERVWSA